MNDAREPPGPRPPGSPPRPLARRPRQHDVGDNPVKGHANEGTITRRHSWLDTIGPRSVGDSSGGMDADRRRHPAVRLGPRRGRAAQDCAGRSARERLPTADGPGHAQAALALDVELGVAPITLTEGTPDPLTTAASRVEVAHASSAGVSRTRTTVQTSGHPRLDVLHRHASGPIGAGARRWWALSLLDPHRRRGGPMPT